MSSFDVLSEKFHTGVRWNIAGSIIYEAIKTAHNFFLFGLMNHTAYGFLGSALSIIYFSSKIADFGATPSLPPFFHYLMRNKQTFRGTLVNHYLIPHLPLIIIVAVTATAIYSKKFSTLLMIEEPNIPWFVITLLIALIIGFESIRYFLRLFLHTALKNRIVVATEVVLFINFIALIWIPHLFFNQPLSIIGVLFAHVIDSCLCVAIFIYILTKFYQNLPMTKEPITIPTHKRMTVAKLTNHALRISRDLFTSNVLTPLFALKCCLGQAGIFYFAAIIVGALQATIKISIHFPGYGLLSNIKESNLTIKKTAFAMLCQKLTQLITPIVIFMIINHSLLFNRGQQQSTTYMIMIIILVFLPITLIDSFLRIYEQFYVIEETSARLLLLKAPEFLLFYFFVLKNPSTSTITLIITAICIQLFSFGLTIFDAYARWRIIPSIKPKATQVFFWIILSFLFLVFFRNNQ